jgi:DNA topoisomerase-6 subunit B
MAEEKKEAPRKGGVHEYRPVVKRTIIEHFAENIGQLGYSGLVTPQVIVVHELVSNSLDNLQESGRLGDILVKIEKTKKGYLKIMCKDNGTGLSREDAVLAFSEMLASSRFVASATRGAQGIGVSGVILYGYQTTNEATIVKTSTGDSKLHILTIRPFGEKEERVTVETTANEQKFKGTIVECCISCTGKGEEGERKLLYLGKDSAGGKGESERTIYSYLRQTAIANPFAKITLVEPDGSKTVFERTSKIVPSLPPVTKPHPYGVSVADVIRMRSGAILKKRYKTAEAFLRGEFIRITPSKVEEISAISGIDMKTPVDQLTAEGLEKITESFHKIKFLAPPIDILPPIGQEALESSFKSDLKPKFMHYTCRRPVVSENGHPIMVEVVAAVGGESGMRGREEVPVELIRFANRVPLVFSKGDCVIYNTAYPNTKEKQSTWRRWGVDPLTTPVTIAVSVMSTRIPYTSPAKTAVSEDKIIGREILLATRDALLQIGKHLQREKRAEIRARRSTVLKQYIDAALPALQYLAGKTKPPMMAKIYKRIEAEAGKFIEAPQPAEEKQKVQNKTTQLEEKEVKK